MRINVYVDARPQSQVQCMILTASGLNMRINIYVDARSYYPPKPGCDQANSPKSRSGSPRPKWKPSWRKLKLAKEQKEEQARFQDEIQEWEFQEYQKRLHEAFKVYTTGFQAGSSGDDFVRGWESTKRQVLGFGDRSLKSLKPCPQAFEISPR